MANAQDIKNLREITGAGVMECKKALEESQGDFAAAQEWIKVRGLAKAEKKADRETKEGYIASYVHANGKIAALVEILCETDFVARNSELQALGKDLAMQVVAMSPADVDELLAQESIKDGSQTIEAMTKGLSAKIGEKIIINRITRLSIGE